MLSTLRGAFSRSLKNYPVLTNTSIYASFYLGAEFSQQSYKKYVALEQKEYDFIAAGRIASVGSLLYSPTLYYWYRYLDSKFVGTSVRVVLTKALSDQLIMTPILLACFFMVNSVLERKENIFEELQEKYWKTFLANQSFWMPAQIINFSLIPNHLRVVYVASASFIWINILCYIKRQKLKSQ